MNNSNDENLSEAVIIFTNISETNKTFQHRKINIRDPNVQFLHFKVVLCMTVRNAYSYYFKLILSKLSLKTHSARLYSA